MKHTNEMVLDLITLQGRKEEKKLFRYANIKWWIIYNDVKKIFHAVLQMLLVILFCLHVVSASYNKLYTSLLNLLKKVILICEMLGIFCGFLLHAIFDWEVSWGMA